MFNFDILSKLRTKFWVAMLIFFIHSGIDLADRRINPLYAVE